MISIIYGILSAASWGSGDFAGGLSSRKVGAYRAVFFADFFGLLILMVASFFYRETLPSTNRIVVSALGGMLGTLGLLILYYSLSKGQMSIAAPVSALFAAFLPVVVGALTEGLPTLLQLLGFLVALAAVWLISQGNSGERFAVGISRLADIRLPLLAGLGFGSYFIFMHIAVKDSDATLWPMIISRLAGTILLGIIVIVRRESLGVPHGAWLVVLLNATLDLTGNLFYILASKTGRLDVAAILSSLYPGATVILASIILKERIRSAQWLGILSALIAIVLFTA